MNWSIIMQHLEQVIALLRDDGFKITPQRTAIVDYLLRTEDHPSAELIHKVVRRKYPNGQPVYSLQDT